MKTALHIALSLLALISSGSCAVPLSSARQNPSGGRSSAEAPDFYQQQRHEYFFHEAVHQSTSQNYAEAFDLMRYCIEIDTTSAAARYQLAQYYILLNDKEQPTRLLLEAVAQEPDNYWYRRLLALNYQRLYQNVNAIRVYEDMVRDFPTRTDILIDLANMYDEIGQFRKELNTLNRFALLEDAADMLSVPRFLCYLKLEKYDSAYYEVRTNIPQTIDALMESVNNLKGLEMVVKFCQEVERQDPTQPQSYLNLAVVNYQQQQKEQAYADIARGLVHVTDSMGLSALYSLRGEFHNVDGRRDLTYLDYDTALVYNPNDIGVLNNYAYFLSLENRKLDRALQMSRTTITLQPENYTYLDTYAWILFSMGRYAEALQYITQAIENGGSESADVVEHYGDILFMCGQPNEALNYWHAAVRLGSQSKTLEQKILLKKYINE